MESSPLTEACMNNDLHKVQEAIEESPDLLLTRDGDGRVPVHWAVSFQNEEIVLYLLSHMKSVDIDELKDDAGWTPFHIACSVGNMTILLELYNRQAKPNLDLTTNQGVTCLHLAISKKHIEICRFLLDNGASVRIKDKKQQIPLHRAAAVGSLALVELLCKYKSPVNVQDNQGWTPLFHALAEGHGDVATALTNVYHADDQLQDQQGAKAIDVALNEEVKKYYTNHTA